MDAQKQNAAGGSGAKSESHANAIDGGDYIAPGGKFNADRFLTSCAMNIPDTMKSAKRWLVWKSIPNTDPTKKPRKVPFYPNGTRRNGTMDTAEDVAQFGTFEDAMRAMDAGGFTGLGFALGADGTGNHWQGIDLDGMSHRPALSVIFAHLMGMTYCETSPNGDGIHAIGHGSNFPAMGSTSDGIEAYSGGRFFTVTGSGLNTLPLHDLHGFIESELRPRRATVEPRSTVEPAALAITPGQVADLRSALLSLRSDDRGLWVDIGLALKPLGDAGRGLWMEWSAQSDKFDARDSAVTWDGFNTRDTDYRAVFAKAQAHGWVNPARRNPATIFAGGVPPPPPAAGMALFDAPALPVADVRDGTTVTRSLTELGNAQRMADLHGDGVRYVPETKGWLYWHDGAAWQWDTSGTVMRELAAQLPRVIYSEGAGFDMTQAEHCAKWARKSQTAQVLNNAVSLLSGQSSIRLSLAMIDADRWLIGFDNARQVIDLRTGNARAATPADYVTKSLAPCTMGDSAKAVRWLAFLDQIFAGDAELIGWLHRWCGYLLTGETSEQIFLFFFGLGANGKSVFAEAIRHVMGDYARTVASETLAETKRQAGGASPDLADLIGCRLALSTETEDGSALAESFVKTITGGDSITTRKLYCEPVQFTPAFKLLMLGNHRPIIRGTDHGIWRRVRILPFTRTFTEQERDPHLLDKLKAEAPHILAWMVQGCIEWQRRGLFDVPAAIANQTADYRAEQDVIGQWLADCTTASRYSETDTGALYDSYRIWAINSGLKPASNVSLGRRLKERGFVQRLTHGRRLWCGIALKFNAGTPFAK